MVNVAIPPLSVPVPIGLPPSRNVTVPVAVPAPGATAETVAVKVTDCPNTDGFTDEVTAVVVSAFITVRGAVEVFPDPAVVSLALTLLLAAPTFAPCTFKETVQLVPGARLELARDTEPEPAFAVAVPLQLLLKPLGVATINDPGALLGRVSLNVMALSVRFWLVLLT